MIRQTLATTKAATFCLLLPSPFPRHRGMPIPTGTGFFVSPDGWFVTAAHVLLDKAGRVRTDVDQAWLNKELRPDEPVALAQWPKLDYVDHEADIALLRIDLERNRGAHQLLEGREGFPYVSVSSRSLVEGEPVYSFGYPLSTYTVSAADGMALAETRHSPRTTSAIVSSTVEFGGGWVGAGEPAVYVLDKALNYGNSGGPVIAAETGNVHAVCTRFQPVSVPQPHIAAASGEPLIVRIPSLYGVVSSLSHPRVLAAFDERKIPEVAR